MKKSIICSICGSANVGKSSLMNKIIGFDLSIVSAKPQTTRSAIKGIVSLKNTQIIFIDTPGIFKPKHSALEKQIVKNAWSNVFDCDLCILVLDNDSNFNLHSKTIINKMKESNIEIICFINKSDIGSIENRIKIVETVNQFDNSIEIICGSVKSGKNIDILLDKIISKAKRESFVYNESLISDASFEFIASEFMREALFNKLDQEIPYGLEIEIEKIEQLNEVKNLKILILCAKENHKKIIIGKNGESIKKSIITTIEKLEKLYGEKFSINAFIKVKKELFENKN